MSFQNVSLVMVWKVPSSAATRSEAVDISAVLAAATCEAVADASPATPAAAVSALANGAQDVAV